MLFACVLDSRMMYFIRCICQWCDAFSKGVQVDWHDDDSSSGHGALASPGAKHASGARINGSPADDGIHGRPLARREDVSGAHPSILT